MTARTWNSRYVDFAFASLIVLAGMISLALLLAMLAPPRLEATLTAADIVADGGFAYRTPVRAPAGFRIVGDSGAASTISRLQLREDGKLLGPDHAGHADIRQAGGGRYSHWGTGLWFSASDSSDPRSNGRSYAISARASVHPLAFAAVALFDVLVLMVSWRWIAAHAGVRRALVGIPMLVALLLAALVAVGTFGRLNEAAGEPKDAALVVATLAHALLGCAVLVAQWAAGAGLARSSSARNNRAWPISRCSDLHWACRSPPPWRCSRCCCRMARCGRCWRCCCAGCHCRTGGPSRAK